MFEKPFRREVSDPLQSSRLFEQMRRTGNDDQPLFATQRRVRLFIQLDNRRIVPAHDQERGGLYLGQRFPRQIGPPTTRNDRADSICQSGRRDQRRRRAGAGPKIADGQSARARL